MKYLYFTFPLVMIQCAAWADEEDAPVCKHCQIIREYNRTHKETDFVYYEDYLNDKAEKKGLTAPAKETASADSTPKSTTAKPKN